MSPGWAKRSSDVSDSGQPCPLPHDKGTCSCGVTVAVFRSKSSHQETGMCAALERIRGGMWCSKDFGSSRRKPWLDITSARTRGLSKSCLPQLVRRPNGITKACPTSSESLWFNSTRRSRSPPRMKLGLLTACCYLAMQTVGHRALRALLDFEDTLPILKI